MSIKPLTAPACHVVCKALAPPGRPAADAHTVRQKSIGNGNSYKVACKLFKVSVHACLVRYSWIVTLGQGAGERTSACKIDGR